MEPAHLRVPAEIWHHIFRLYLGPRLSSTKDGDLRYYTTFLFDTEQEICLKYQIAEKKRSILRLVCRSWNGFADSMRLDRLIICEDSFIWHQQKTTWPPGQTVSAATRVFYRVKGTCDTSLFAEPVRAETCTLTACYIGALDEHPSHQPQHCPLRAFEWHTRIGYVSATNIVPTLRAPCFVRLVVLKLVASYSSFNSSTSVGFSLPELQCLILRMQTLTQDEPVSGLSFSTWRFPQLRALEITGDFFPGQMHDELESFCHEHARQIEELSSWVVCPQTRRRRPMELKWDAFERLRVCHCLDLTALASHMKYIRPWQDKYARRLEVYLSHVRSSTISVDNIVLPTFESHKDILHFLSLVYPETWEDIGGLLDHWSLARMSDVPSEITEFRCVFSMVKEYGMRVADATGASFDSPSAVRFRERFDLESFSY